MRINTSNFKNKQFIVLTLISLLLVFAIRFVGIDWGFPNIYHPDEPTVIKSAMGVRFGMKNPGHFDWPHFQIYTTYLGISVFSAARSLILSSQFSLYFTTHYHKLFNDPFSLYMLGRFITVIESCVLILAVFFIVKSLTKSNLLSIVSIILIGFNPLLMEHSHFATVDIPMIMFMYIAFLFLFKYLKTNTLNHFYVASIFVGFAISSKYNAGITVLALIYGSFYFFTSLKKSIILLLKSGILVIAGFLLFTPFALFDYDTFLITSSPKGALWQFVHVGSDSINSNYFLNLVTIFKDLIKYSGIFLTSFSLIGIFKSWRNRELRPLLLTIIVYLLYLGNFSYYRVHFLLLVIPAMVIITSFFLHNFSGKLKTFWVVVLLIESLILGSLSIITYSRKDTRDIVTKYIESTLPSKSIIAKSNDYEPILSTDDDDPRYYYFEEYSKLSSKDNIDKTIANLMEKNVDAILFGTYDLIDSTEFKNDKLPLLKRICSDLVLQQPYFQPGPDVVYCRIRE